MHFSIHGDFITNHFRSIVLEGNWRRAVTDLQESLIGISIEQVHDVLSGKKQLDGINEIYFIDDNKFDDQNFINKQYFTYFHNIYLINDTFYKKYKSESISKFYDFYELKEIHDLKFTPTPETTQERLFLQFLLAKHVMKSYDDIIIPIHNDFCFFEKATVDFPSWLSFDHVKKILSSKNLTENLKSLNVKIHGLDLIDFEPEEEQELFLNQIISQTEEADFDNIKEIIRLQAEKLGGFIDLHDKNLNKTYTVPKHPFLKWCLSESPVYRTIEWTAVNSSGQKCAGDDPNHTDWFLFTGLDLDIAQDSSIPEIDFFYKMRHEYNEKYTKTNLKPLIKGSVGKIEKSKIVHITDPLDTVNIGKNTIVVIPNANPEFTNIAHLCADLKCPIITETGGALCHLAIVGKEFGLTLYLMPEAMNKLPKGATASIKYKKDQYDDSFTANIEVNDYPLEYMEQLMKLKISGLYYK